MSTQGWGFDGNALAKACNAAWSSLSLRESCLQSSDSLLNERVVLPVTKSIQHDSNPNTLSG